MSRKIGYELINPNALKNSRCSYLCFFLIFALVVTAYYSNQYRVRNLDPSEKLEMISIPKMNVGVQNESQQNDEESVREEPLPPAEKSSNFIPKSGKQNTSDQDSELSRVDQMANEQIIENNRSPSLQSREHSSDSSRFLSIDERNVSRTTNTNSRGSGFFSDGFNTSSSSLISPNSNKTEKVETNINSESILIPNATNLNESAASTNKSIISNEKIGDLKAPFESTVSSDVENNPGPVETKENNSHFNETGMYLNISEANALPNFTTELTKMESR